MGKVVVKDGIAINIPEFPYEFFASTESMGEEESSKYFDDLRYVLKDENYWLDFIPLCPKCKELAEWTDAETIPEDMVILHTHILDWVLDNYAENKIRNADNVLVQLKCGCKLTVRDKIELTENPGGISAKQQEISKKCIELLRILKTDEDIVELVKEFKKNDKTFIESIGKKLDKLFKELYQDQTREKPLLDEESLFKGILATTIKEFKVNGEDEINRVRNIDYKGKLIANGYCDKFVNLLLINLMKVIESKRIKIYNWEYIHTFIVIDEEYILDPDLHLIRFSRDKLNELFLHYVASIAVVLNEYHYIVAPNEKCIIYDPWGFVDNQDFNHEGKNLIASIENVYSVEKYINAKRENNE